MRRCVGPSERVVQGRDQVADEAVEGPASRAEGEQWIQFTQVLQRRRPR